MKKRSAQKGTKTLRPKAKKQSIVEARKVQALFTHPNEKRVYDEDFHPLDFITHCKEGNSPNYIAACWGVTKDTLNRWARTKDSFKKAYQVGRTCYLAFWEKKLRDYTLQEITWREFNIESFKILSKNLMRWSELTPQDAFDGVAENEFEVLDISDNRRTDAFLNDISDKDEDL